mgnify:CR=1 FL=1
MATITYDKDIDVSLLKTLKIGIIGYGSQGHAHALNLKDSGANVRVGLHEGSKSKAKAEEAGLQVHSVAELTQWADVLMFTVPDVPMRHIYAADVAPHLRAGQTLLFAHGFNIRYDLIVPPTEVGVAMVAPKGPGHRLRGEYVGGAGMPALIAVHQDPAGDAKAVALAYASGIGSGKAGILETTFKEETETDLFGEQVVLCGGLAALIKAGFETLVEAGYQPEAAYFECLHETKLIVDLLYTGGLDYMRYSISETAEWGDYITGPKIVTDETKATMKKVLADIQDGTFAKEWIAESEGGYPRMTEYRKADKEHPLETVGKELRAMMPFLQNAK